MPLPVSGRELRAVESLNDAGINTVRSDGSEKFCKLGGVGELVGEDPLLLLSLESWITFGNEQSCISS
jgi:hypothetical protein